MSKSLMKSSSRPKAPTGASLAAAGRRRGQALLLAVLLMVFAALLGSTFVTVVALNLQQTAREEDKLMARSAARAGLQLVNAQLTAQGTDWRPERLAPPPAPRLAGPASAADPTYNVYWTEVEKAQGWARTVDRASAGDTVPPPANGSASSGVGGDWNNDGVFQNPALGQYEDDWAKLERAKEPANGAARVFVKFPNPLEPQNSGTPSYLAEVTPILNGTPGASADKIGTLRLTIIGQSQDDPAVFERRTAYKGTPQNGGPFSYAVFDSNYDSKKQRFIETKTAPTPATNVVTAASIAAGTQIVLADASGIEPGRLLIIQQGTDYMSFMVAAVSGNTITPSTTYAPQGMTTITYAPGATVKAASTLTRGLSTLDADGYATSAAVAPLLPSQLLSRDRSTVPGSVAGMFVNGGLVAQDRSTLELSTTRRDPINVAGLIVSNPAARLRDATAPTTSTTTDLFPDSTMLASPPAGGLTILQKLVRDGSGASNNDPTAPDQGVRSLTPPSIEGGFSRHLEKTKYASVTEGSAYGYGPGIYIDNAEDIEKISTGANAFRTLTNSEMHRLWQRKPFGGMTYALAYAAPTAVSTTYPSTTATDSLEQRGVRGWVSPWEFRPRGVLIELERDDTNNQDIITITRDDRADATSTTDPVLHQPDAKKEWKTWQDANGVSWPSGLRSKTYRTVLTIADGTNIIQRRAGAPGNEQVLTDPTVQRFNGVIYAEGNVRIRGKVGRKSITVVSMGNIYIEGNLRRSGASPADGRIALLAKRNVTLNPTQFLAHEVYYQDRDVVADAANQAQPSAASAGATTITVSSSAPFRVGDRVRINGQDASLPAPSTWTGVFTVTGVPSTTQIQINPALPNALTGPTATPAEIVRIAMGSTDPAVVSGRDTALFATATDQTPEYFYNLTNGATLRRVLKFDGGASWTNDNAPTSTAVTASPYYLSMPHGGQRKQAFEISRSQGGGQGEEIRSKEDGNTKVPADSTYNPANATPDNIIDPTEQRFRTKSSSNNWEFDYDLLQLPSTTAAERGDDARQTLDKLVASPNFYSPASSQRWTFANVAANPSGIAARRLASLVNTTVPATGQPVHVPLTVSAGLFWQGGTTPLATIGSYFRDNSLVGTAYPTSATDPRVIEDLATVRESFYQTPANGLQQANMQWYNRQLVDGTTTQASPISNLIELRSDNEPNLPAYRTGALRIERDDFTVGSYERMQVLVEATIYAQDGSWFVIPQPMRQAYNTAGNAVPFDVDGNGSNTDPIDLATATRYRRANYEIKVRGNIAQNHAPTTIVDYDNAADPDGKATPTGAVAQWLDAVSFPAVVANNSSNIPEAQSWQTIRYEADQVPLDNELELPATPDLVFVG